MGIEIPAELRAFVERELKTGLYRSEQDVVTAALRLLRAERADAVKGILAGLDDVAAGRIQSFDDAFDELRAELNLPPDD